jgi:hypothetical protein
MELIVSSLNANKAVVIKLCLTPFLSMFFKSKMLIIMKNIFIGIVDSSLTLAEKLNGVLNQIVIILLSFSKATCLTVLFANVDSPFAKNVTMKIIHLQIAI